ncbi:copper amine oxidase N-terminal domain-containing protein [Paenibacillus sp. ACRSA]|uniref:copper amine oxidase N-terminal domain-containing protein n=1 Tax=Paenibacillus sp. ACRSA TaxID=2918211 RepID=UPI001EF57DCF|nr:copper amine oxidase N-terminal domain-containing protein [Paenibacillus sp. ACRSA]MCG7378846.1 copper amine oxidase N-terminal domain-containing protein [Paenibacillus sp. ACRSA]
MKRMVKVGLTGVLLTSVFSAGAYAASLIPKIFIHGNQINSSSTAPKLIDGSVYVPLRTISEGLGVDIQWDNINKTVYVNSDPQFKAETGSVTYVNQRNLAFQWIMAYDDRLKNDVIALTAPGFKTNLYNESIPSGTYNMASIVEMHPVDRNDTSITVRIVQRVTAEDNYNVKTEKWKFTFEGTDKIKSVMVVPKSTQYFDRYTLFPGTSFGE